jgi:hypothetical protein
MKSAALIISMILNFGLVFMLFAQAMDGCAEEPDGRVGVLTQDVEVGVFDTNETIYRFRIVVTANNERFVDYEPSEEDLAVQSAEYYSAEISEGRP